MSQLVIRKKDFCTRYGIGATTWFRMVKAGVIKPIKLVPGGRAVGILASDADALLAGRIEERDAHIVP